MWTCVLPFREPFSDSLLTRSAEENVGDKRGDKCFEIIFAAVFHLEKQVFHLHLKVLSKLSSSESDL